MKKFLMIASVLALGSGSSAFAKKATLLCTSGDDFVKFSARIDSSAFTPGSGVFEVKSANYRDNYETTESMTCTLLSEKRLSCIGYTFGTSGFVTEVSIEKKDGVLQATKNVIRGNLPGRAEPMPCSVQN